MALALAITPAPAADLGGECCADLAERIAELEASAVRKGSRKVSLAIAGHVSHAVLFWDDGRERNAYVLGDKNDQSNISLIGEAAISPDVTAGHAITLRLKDNLSDEVDQESDDGEAGFVIWESYWFLDSKRFGRLSVGQTSRVSDTAPETDLSETGLPAYAGVQDLSGGFLLSLGGALPGVTLGDVYNHFNGDTANVVRYDTAPLAGLVLSASYGEDDVWDVGARYEGSFSAIKVAGSTAYTRSRDENGLDGGGDLAHATSVGSAAVLHEPSGLNALVAAGSRSFDTAVTDFDGADRRPADARFVYAKLGWLADLVGLGPTAFYGEYGRFRDYVSAGFDPTAIDPAAGPGTRVAGNTAEVFGLGVVQHIEAAEMQVYIGYRRHEFDFDLRDGGGAVAAPAAAGYATLLMGSKFSF